MLVWPLPHATAGHPPQSQRMEEENGKHIDTPFFAFTVYNSLFNS
uniref:Uncharacterized protein n=1 Tax=Arundo donax TaxID=35708 RepID=A0A0A9FTA0_ARUDO